MAALLLSTSAAGIFLHLSDGKRIKELESQMSQMRKQDRKSVMDRRVSKQMEEIAYGQQLLGGHPPVGDRPGRHASLRG